MALLPCSFYRPKLLHREVCRVLTCGRRHLTNNGFFRVAEEVREALHTKKPVVALETTIYTHGFPYPDNVALASLLESVVRVNGGIPATIGILDGVARVGMDPEELIRLTSSAGKDSTLKLSRRDLSHVCGLRLAGKQFNGGTTVSGTMLLAHLAGIRLFGTGGLGGVHRGAELSMDVSADLRELGRTPVAVVSSGCKSFLDIPRTLEYLETEGVGVGTFADNRGGNVDFPAFWSRDSGIESPVTIANEKEAAAMIYAQNSLEISSGLLFANPIPAEAGIPSQTMNSIIEEAIRHADSSNASGKLNTPFILGKIKELTEGKSVTANRALIEANVRRATIVAQELAVLETTHTETRGRNNSDFHFVEPSPVLAPEKRGTIAPFSKTGSCTTSVPTRTSVQEQNAPNAEIVVAGALAIDFSCDYTPFSNSSSYHEPILHTSNPAFINQTLGGVAHNIAKSSHLLGSSVQLLSAVGDDLSGRAAIAKVREEGMSTSGIDVLSKPARTAQYVAINNAKRDLAVAMADMSIFENIPQSTVSNTISNLKTSSSRPKVFIVDANWSAELLHMYLSALRHPATTTIFEPVSTAKALRIFSHVSPRDILPVFPRSLLDIITPNVDELTALYTYGQDLGLFDHPDWFTVIDALGISPNGLRVPLAHVTNPQLVDEGIPQQAIKLLPLFPTILTKLGPRGVLLTQLVPSSSKLCAYNDSRYMLSKCKNGDKNVGGLYVRLYPTEKVFEGDEIVSVNGVGDTFCGALASGLAKGLRVHDVIPFAQKAAGLSLRSSQSVSPELRDLSRAAF